MQHAVSVEGKGTLQEQSEYVLYGQGDELPSFDD